MTMRGRSAALAAATLLAAVLPALGQEIGWIRDVRAALDRAAESGRPLVVDFWAVWCAPCQQMEQTTWGRAEVVEAVSAFVPLKVNFDAQQVFVRRYRVEAIPVVLILDEHGEEITRHLGMIGAEELVELLGKVQAGYAAYREALSGDDPDALLAAADFLASLDAPSRAAELLEERLDRAPPARRAELACRIGELCLAADEAKDAARWFGKAEKLAGDGPAARRALEGLVRAERARGRERAAREAEERLRRLGDRSASGRS
ncbi:MAG: hypothetical protein Kow0062_18780 [Acidobacteriota bacterium]